MQFHFHLQPQNKQLWDVATGACRTFDLTRLQGSESMYVVHGSGSRVGARVLFATSIASGRGRQPTAFSVWKLEGDLSVIPAAWPDFVNDFCSA